MRRKLMKNAQVISKLDGISQIVPAADVTAFFRSLLDAFREEQTLRRDLARVEATRDMVLAEITRRYDLYHRVFDRIFDERQTAIDRHFEIIDRGIAADDKELIVEGLKGLSTIVSSSPFSDLQELSKLLESGQKIEI